MHCHAIQWFFAPFCCGKNNGGRASFQTKRAQQVSCLSIVVGYIVLCSEKKHNYTWKIASLQHVERSSDQDSSWSRSIRGALQACFASLFWIPWVFHHCSKQTFLFILLSWSYLKAQLRPREDWLCKGNWLISRRRSIAKLETGVIEEKKYGKGLLLVGRSRGQESPCRHFWP